MQRKHAWRAQQSPGNIHREQPLHPKVQEPSEVPRPTKKVQAGMVWPTSRNSSDPAFAQHRSRVAKGIVADRVNAQGPCSQGPAAASGCAALAAWVPKAAPVPVCAPLIQGSSPEAQEHHVLHYRAVRHGLCVAPRSDARNDNWHRCHSSHCEETGHKALSEKDRAVDAAPLNHAQRRSCCPSCNPPARRTCRVASVERFPHHGRPCLLAGWPRSMKLRSFADRAES